MIEDPFDNWLFINLWRCDCANHGHDTNSDNHQAECGYVHWASQQNREDFDVGDPTDVEDE